MQDEFLFAKPEEVGFKPTLTETIDATADQNLKEGRIACDDIAVARHGKIVYYRQHGFFDLKEQIELKPEMLFRFASMTKPITSAAVLMQQERGLLSYEDPVSDYIPCFKEVMTGIFNEDQTELLGTRRPSREIRIRDLLTHSSGIGTGKYYMNHIKDYSAGKGQVLADMMPAFSKCPLCYDPGTSSSYSPLMAFDILLHIVELTSGKTADRFLKENIFEPLGMDSTLFFPAPVCPEKLVRLCAQTETGAKQLEDRASIGAIGCNATYFSGAGALLGTALDYHRFAQMLVNRGTYRGVRILKEETVEDMGRAHLACDIPGNSDPTRSWGWGVRTVLEDNGSQKPLTKGSYGWSGAYGTHFWIDPKNELTVVYFSNMSTAGGSGAVTARQIERDVYASLEK